MTKDLVETYGTKLTKYSKLTLMLLEYSLCHSHVGEILLDYDIIMKESITS